MIRNFNTKKHLPKQDIRYENFLIGLLINKVLKEGKKVLAEKITYAALDKIEVKTLKNPIIILEQAVKNVTPRVYLKNQRIGPKIYKVAEVIERYKATNLAVRWLLECAKKRTGHKFYIKLADELLDAAKGIGAAIRKKEELHKIAESTKDFFENL